MTPDSPSASGYRPRIADRELTERLSAAGAVVIEGPRVCGKTTTARQAAVSEVLMDADPAVRQTMAVDPRLLLEGATPRLIDEWQAEPDIWNYVRRAVDDRPGLGHFILTGSAVPPDDITRHTGAGRMSRLRLRPMSLFELGRATGQVSLGRILKGEPVPSLVHDLPLPDLATLVCVGGWPGHFRRKSDEAALLANRDYLDEVRRVDIRRVDGISRDPERVGRFLQTLARNTATCASVATMAKDTGGTDHSLSKEAARSYLSALERLMVFEQQPPWAPHLRSRSRLRHAPKRHFTDPSLATAALNAGPENLMKDIPWFGLLFESMVVRDLRVYAQAMDGRVYHYRDNTGLEVDAIVDAGPGRWAAFEVKLGQGRIDQAAAALLRFADRVDTGRSGEPAALGVITGSGYGYQRPDGVGVIPVGALGP